jgi:hypothetical protein
MAGMSYHRLPSRMIRVGALALTVSALSLGVARAQDPARRLYHDQAHGQTPLHPAMNELAATVGFGITIGSGPLDATALAGHHLVYLRAPTKPFGDAERAVLTAFVRAGGALLVVVDEESRQKLADTRVNEILAPFGVALTPDTPYLHNTGALATVGEINHAPRELPYSGGRAVEGGTAFAWQLDAAGKPAQPFACWTKVDGGGRLVVMGEGMASLLLGTVEGQRLTGKPRDPAGTVYWGKDSRVFMEEVLRWLLAR